MSASTTSSSSVEHGFNFSKFYSGEFEKISEHIYRLNIPYAMAEKVFPKFTIPVSVFLVHDSLQSRYSLVDVGPPGYEQIIMKALAKFFDKGEEEEHYKQALLEIDQVLITHFHIDHCGGVRKLWEYSDQALPVYSHSQDLEYIRDGKKFREQKSEYWLFGMTKYLFSDPKMEVPCQNLDMIMNSKESTIKATTRDYIKEEKKNETSEKVVENGQQIIEETQHETNNSKSSTIVESSSNAPHRHCLCACHCPGHTAGHTCFYHEEDRVLICGDALQNLTKKKSKLEYSYPLSSFNLSMSKQNIKQLVNSLSNEIDIVFPSHTYSMSGHTIEEVLKFVNK
ncbi:hypothetical protein C9374_011261 [Naegleria lovaniensis]|uniref:Metallo-beta-lactamase domain-containing protein n=1 Tax=Naegleria lovaniensis TaxID=51637 RepID=A0AA88H1W3_NAELO|nr:uncharacterized protein C9374_011261 [Naegleria lovaniensis]KAG2392536.1 hypothetical protein C9374_011261 [Naegleria lovaniensis]